MPFKGLNDLKVKELSLTKRLHSRLMDHTGKNLRKHDDLSDHLRGFARR